MVARRTSRRRLGLRPRRPRSGAPSPRPRPSQAAFAMRPFPRTSGPAGRSVSVVVCAYNAADTLDDCLTALAQQTYPDYEVIVVNDGSRDRTSDVGRRHPSVRVIDIPNGGLSAARNVGLGAATGDIVAYTDADTRADRDWLTFLVQPFLTSDVVGSGGPNVVPPDDPPMAQCIARAPGGPTHVLLDDRIAEHVPGLQHGLPSRGAALDRRLQSHLPPCRRRCRRVLAAAGQGLEDRLRLVSAGVAPPSSVDQGLLAATGRVRRGRALAHGASPRQVPGRPHVVARPDLQPAAVRALALGRTHQRRRVGHGGVPVGLPHGRSPVCLPAALGPVAGAVDRPDAVRPGRLAASATRRGQRRCWSRAASALPPP